MKDNTSQSLWDCTLLCSYQGLPCINQWTKTMFRSGWHNLMGSIPFHWQFPSSLRRSLLWLLMDTCSTFFTQESARLNRMSAWWSDRGRPAGSVWVSARTAKIRPSRDRSSRRWLTTTVSTSSSVASARRWRPCGRRRTAPAPSSEPRPALQSPASVAKPPKVSPSPFRWRRRRPWISRSSLSTSNRSMSRWHIVRLFIYLSFLLHLDYNYGNGYHDPQCLEISIKSTAPAYGNHLTVCPATTMAKKSHKSPSLLSWAGSFQAPRKIQLKFQLQLRLRSNLIMNAYRNWACIYKWITRSEKRTYLFWAIQKKDNKINTRLKTIPNMFRV